MPFKSQVPYSLLASFNRASRRCLRDGIVGNPQDRPRLTHIRERSLHPETKGCSPLLIPYFRMCCYPWRSSRSDLLRVSNAQCLQTSVTCVPSASYEAFATFLPRLSLGELALLVNSLPWLKGPKNDPCY